MSELHPPQHDHHCYLHLPPPFEGAEPETWHIDMIHSQIYFNCTLILPSGKRISRTLIIPPHIQAQLADPFAPTNGANRACEF
jgi:hypothetical protein